MTLPIQSIELPAQCDRIALCGGPYSNFAAVEAFLDATRTIPERFCLGDIGGFGPWPDRTLDLLREAQVTCLQGNYDHAVGHGERDCGCGYSDPRDQEFAQISYDYTFAHTATHHRDWLRTLPPLIELHWGTQRILLCHGSPGGVNEFVWESKTTDDDVQQMLQTYGVGGICGTHSGLPWLRQTDGGFWFNVGVLGRPAHEGKPHVYYGLLEKVEGVVQPRLMPLTYDVATVVNAMREAGLPQEFCESLEQGIWTTCAEILPPAEKLVRSRV
ncbi:MAG: metallophosphoesterase [Cyanobacteria bacterium P01_D01_bin.44]